MLDPIVDPVDKKLVSFSRDPETNSEIAHENGWLKYYIYIISFLGWPIFRGELLVSGRVGHAENLKKIHDWSSFYSEKNNNNISTSISLEDFGRSYR